MIKLYDHQAEQIERVREAMRHSRTILMQMPTGGGKSVESAAMIAASREKNNSAIFCVPRIDLMRQMSNTFRAFDIPHSFIAQGQSFNRHARTHIASLGTLVKRLDKTDPIVIFIDETHWGKEMVDALIKHFRAKNIWIIGLSATPARTDNFGMGGWYEVMVQGPSIRWLIDNRFLSEYALVQPSVQLARGQIGGNPIDEWLRHAGDRLTITYCRDKAHGIRTAAEFTAAGIPSAFMEANTPPDERRRIITDFANGKIVNVVNCYLLQMGFDLASQIGRKVNVRCMLDLQPTGSLTSQMQKNGRPIRYDESGHAVIIDLAGNSYEHNHGLPCADREWILDSGDCHARDVEFRERTLSLTKCNACYRPSKIGPLHCPYCGTRFAVNAKRVREVDGKLVVITPEMLRDDERRAARSRKQRGMEEWECKTLADWQELAKQRGHSQGWAYIRYNKAKNRSKK